MKIKKDLDLYVKIPEKFKKEFYNRLDLRRVKKIGEANRYLSTFYDCGIEVESVLCKEYRVKDCRGCPFSVLGEGGCGRYLGCREWMSKVLEVSYDDFMFDDCFSGIYWSMEDNKEARKQIKAIKKGLYKYVRWV